MYVKLYPLSNKFLITYIYIYISLFIYILVYLFMCKLITNAFNEIEKVMHIGERAQRLNMMPNTAT
jgi:hypothetical protein